MTWIWTGKTQAWACLVAMTLGACASDGKHDDRGARPDGGSEHDDAGTVRRDAGEQAPDAGEGDASVQPERDGSVEPDPIAGGPGCGVGSLCLNLRVAYAEAVQEAKSCSPSQANACALQAPPALGCESCPVWVNDTARLDALRSQFVAAGCENCFYGSPTDDRCHPEPCNELGAPLCDPAGTCVPDLSCPDSAAEGVSCRDQGLSFCGGGANGKSCICLGDVWECE